MPRPWWSGWRRSAACAGCSSRTATTSRTIQVRDRFGCARILHRADVATGTRDVEIALDGNDPLALDEEALFIPVPGHTPGSTCLLYRGKLLFPATTRGGTRGAGG